MFEEVVGNGNVKLMMVGFMWNYVGMWEEKVLSFWVGSWVKELLFMVEFVEFEEGMVKVVEVISCSGDVLLVIVW